MRSGVLCDMWSRIRNVSNSVDLLVGRRPATLCIPHERGTGRRPATLCIPLWAVVRQRFVFPCGPSSGNALCSLVGRRPATLCIPLWAVVLGAKAFRQRFGGTEGDDLPHEMIDPPFVGAPPVDVTSEHHHHINRVYGIASGRDRRCSISTSACAFVSSGGHILSPLGRGMAHTLAAPFSYGEFRERGKSMRQTRKSAFLQPDAHCVLLLQDPTGNDPSLCS